MKERVCTRGFMVLCTINFLCFMAFYTLIATLPLYLTLDLQAEPSLVAVVLSLFGIAALLIRPLSGFLVDSYPRKIIFLVCLVLLSMGFGLYAGVQSILMLSLLRVLHGFSFGSFTTAATTIVVDIVPLSRRGTGLGFYGLTSALAMSVGPMLGLFIYEKYSADAVFYFAFSLSLVALSFSYLVPSTRSAPEKREEEKEKIPLKERIFLKGSMKAMICVVGGCVGYALITNYISVFVLEQGAGNSAGAYFSFVAIGSIVSRLFAGRFIDGNRLNLIIILSMVFILIGILLLVLGPGKVTFLMAAFFIGLGVGSFMPAYQTFFVNMSSANQRGLASSSFFMAFDFGMSVSILASAFFVKYMDFGQIFLLGALLLVMSLLFFITKVMSK